MSEGRPEELTSYLAAASEKNDALILEALGKLEGSKKRGKQKATVAAICVLTGLSRNTVRNRQWALDRLRVIKKELKAGPLVQSEETSVVEDEVSILHKLRERVRNLQKQNALLYQEILSLHALIDRKDAEIGELKRRRF